MQNNLILQPVRPLEQNTRITITGVHLRDGVDNPFADGLKTRAEQLQGQVVAVPELVARLFGATVKLYDAMDEALMRGSSACLFAVRGFGLFQRLEPGAAGVQPMNALEFGPYFLDQQGLRYIEDLTLVYQESLIVPGA
jgi:hypothetical protein